jgi:5-methylcytosine-specific restriction endonuclease McrA
MQNTLLLNAGFEPLRIVSWQRAFVLIFAGKAEILEEYSTSISTVSRQFAMPAVIKLRRWVNLKRQTPIIRFSRANVYARDEYRCQYCYQKFSERELTLDHVFPVVRGGKKTWENIVTACMTCNQRKSDRSPEELGLKLLNKPRVPQWLPGMFSTIRTKSAPDLWVPYLSLSSQTLSSPALSGQPVVEVTEFAWIK